MAQADVVGQIVSLHIYPIKGCKAIDVDSLLAGPRGFPYDRHWVIVSAETRRFITQKRNANLAKITPEIPREAMEGMLHQDLEMVVRLPFEDAPDGIIRIPLAPQQNPTMSLITVGEWTGYAQDEGDGAAEMLSGYLGSSVRLFRFIMDPKIRAYLHKQAQIKENIFRPVDTTFAVGYETTFTDGFPYLIINEASYLNLKDKIDFVLHRFRANIVIRAQNPWEEDEWRQIQIFSKDGTTDGPSFRFIKPCNRCMVTCINQTTALAGVMPLMLLRQIRTGDQTGFAQHLKGMGSQGFFGWNAVISGHDHKRITMNDFVLLVKHGPWQPEATWTEYAQSAWNWVWSSLTGM